MRAGTYAQRVTIEKAVTLQAYPGETPILQPGAGKERNALGITASDVTLDGIIIDGINRVRGLDVYNNAARVTLHNCVIQNCAGKRATEFGQGTIIAAGCSDVTLRRCLFTNIHGVAGDETYCHGIYTGIDNLLVEDCTFTHISGAGIHFYSHMGTYTIRRNYFYRCGMGVGMYHGTGLIENNVIRECRTGAVFNEDIVRVLFAHNTIINSINDGLSANSWGHIESIRLVNNLIYGSGRFGLYSDNNGALRTGALVELEANAFIATAGRPVIQLVSDSPGQVTLTDNVMVASAAFADNGGVEWRLDAPITGVRVAEVTEDYGGNARGKTPQVGAWG